MLTVRQSEAIMFLFKMEIGWHTERERKALFDNLVNILEDKWDSHNEWKKAYEVLP